MGDLARDLGVGERHLRRAMGRELGVSPLELAQTHRLLLAKCLLTDTELPVTHVAFASGFQSLRRFNATFRERYRMSPSALRQRPPAGAAEPALPRGDWVRLTLGYRPPLAWEPLLATVAGDTPAGIGVADGPRYGRTVSVHGCRGVIFLEPWASGPQVDVQLSTSLLPVLMPLLARIRHLLDLDAEPAIIDTHLADCGLAALVARRPGLRMPGAFDGFEVAMRELLGPGRFHRVALALGEPRGRAETLTALARAVAQGTMRLEPGGDVPTALRRLTRIPGIGARTAAKIVLRALHWPDAFPVTDAALRRSAERWRPWRGYAALHLSLAGAARKG